MDGRAGENRSRRTGDRAAVQRVLDALPGMVVFLEGPELRMTAASGAYRAFTGRPDLGTPVREMFAEFGDPRSIDVVERAYRTGVPAQLYELPVRPGAPGAGEPVERFVNLRAHPLRAADGAVAGVLCDTVDVTDRVRERHAVQARATEAQRRYEQAVEVIAALQRELLPAGLPVLPRLQVAASYLLADLDTAAGGDWFDAFTLADGRVGLVVGDVVGHGIAASASMGQLRIVTRERLTRTADPVEALRAADAAAGYIPGARAATACVAVLDLDSGELGYCTAGHPPPLVAAAGGGARFLPASGAGPLGAGGAFGPGVLATDRVGPGEFVLLYTDGLVERPGRTLGETTVDLAGTVADVLAGHARLDDPVPTVEHLCARTVELLTRETGHSDDVTVLAAQRRDPPAALRLDISDDPRLLHDARTRLADWLTGVGAVPADVHAVQFTAAELITNSIEHAHPDAANGTHDITVTVTLEGAGTVVAQVADDGRWRRRRPGPDHGLGLRIAAGLAEDLRFTGGPAGTVATAVHRLSRPGRLLFPGAPPPRAAPAAPADPFLMFELDTAPRPRVRVDGPVDAASAAVFENDLRAAGVAGTRSLTVDLTGVSHLASVGVSVLLRLARGHRDNGSELRLYAPVGSRADLILSLVGIDHHTTDPDT